MESTKGRRFWTAVALFFVGGALAGGVATGYVYSRVATTTLSTIMLLELSEEENRAAAAFRTAASETSVYAQENLIANIDRWKKIVINDDKNLLNTSGLARIRAGISASELNKDKEAAEYFSKAADDLRESGLIKTSDELSKLTEVLKEKRAPK